MIEPFTISSNNDRELTFKIDQIKIAGWWRQIWATTKMASSSGYWDSRTQIPPYWLPKEAGIFGYRIFKSWSPGVEKEDWNLSTYWLDSDALEVIPLLALVAADHVGLVCCAAYAVQSHLWVSNSLRELILGRKASLIIRFQIFLDPNCGLSAVWDWSAWRRCWITCLFGFALCFQLSPRDRLAGDCLMGGGLIFAICVLHGVLVYFAFGNGL